MELDDFLGVSVDGELGAGGVDDRGPDDLVVFSPDFSRAIMYWRKKM